MRELRQDDVIIAARIEPRQGMFTSPKVMVKIVDDFEEHQLFEYFEDEIQFSASEFEGKTIAEAHALKFTRDKAYLQS